MIIGEEKFVATFYEAPAVDANIMSIEITVLKMQLDKKNLWIYDRLVVIFSVPPPLFLYFDFKYAIYFFYVY